MSGAIRTRVGFTCMYAATDGVESNAMADATEATKTIRILEGPVRPRLRWFTVLCMSFPLEIVMTFMIFMVLMIRMVHVIRGLRCSNPGSACRSVSYQPGPIGPGPPAPRPSRRVGGRCETPSRP